MIGLLVLTFICLVAFIKTKSGYWILITLVFFPIKYLQRYFIGVPDAYRWLAFFVLFFLIIGIIYKKKGALASFFSQSPAFYSIFISGWASITFLSLWVNNIPLLSAVLSMRWVFILFGMIFCTYSLFYAEDKDRFLKILLVLGLLNIIVTVIQRVYFVNILRISSGDMVTGIFSNYHNLALYQIFLILLVANKAMHNKRLLRISPLVTIFLLIIPLILSNSKASWIFLLLSILLLLKLNQSQYFAKTLKYAFLIGGLIMLGINAFDKIYSSFYGFQKEESLDYLTNWDYIIRYNFGYYDVLNPVLDTSGSGSGKLGRGAAIIFNYNIIANRYSTLLLGNGPGSVSESNVEGASGQLFAKYQSRYLGRNMIAKVLGELGFAGIFLLFYLMWSFYRFKTKNFTESNEDIVLRKSTIFLLSMLLIYYNVLQTFIAALILSIIFNTNSRRDTASTNLTTGIPIIGNKY